ncbi:MAG: proton-conducting transporter membrane subunit [Eubacteriales bacterium]|nr:proton-conducting transporter membrane subunit [Eubacteriales bacterium]
MQGNVLLFLVAVVPMLAAPLSYALGRKRAMNAVWVMVTAAAAVMAALIGLLVSAAQGAAQSFQWDGFCGLGLSMTADGFRALYACVAGLMWLITSVFSLDYFKHEENVGRYAFFTLMTFGATVGLFLSGTLFSTFLFFEVMSLASYPWVAHEEDPAAMRAAQTYLYIAIIGGLVTLMGLFLLPNGLVIVSYGELSGAAAAVGADRLWLPALLVLFGFGAKAGSFPLHIWLPKAHPVAPAPASALLSGILTKAGVFGMLVLTCLVMKGSFAWGDLIFRLGVITMLLGAALAILSGNLKRTLACSSLSQIGFIMVGIGLCGMLGEENGLAAYGTVGHMVNHSLFKLVLFLCAGAVAMNTHQLALCDVQGFGRKKPLFQAAFLCGALGISGVPLFSGYLSKSLLHEGILELIAHLQAQGQSVALYQLSEYAFLLAGGMTLCYMLKLYVCLFVKKHPTRQAEYDGMKRWAFPLPMGALLWIAALIPLIGVLPQVLMSGFGSLSQSFLEAGTPAHLPIAYFSGENLLGALKSIVIGLALYGVLWALGRRKQGEKSKTALRFDLEDMVYRPVLKLLSWVGYGVAFVLDRLLDWVVLFLKGLGMVLGRLMDGTGDGAVYAAQKTVLSPRQRARPIPVGNRFTFALGTFMDGFVGLLNLSFYRRKPIEFSFVAAFAALHEEVTKESRQLTRSISFGLLMFCLGLFATLVYLLY